MTRQFKICICICLICLAISAFTLTNLNQETPLAESSNKSPEKLAYKKPNLNSTSTTIKEIEKIEVTETQTIVATAITEMVTAYRTPDGEIHKLFRNPTQFGGPRVFQVLDDSDPKYVKVSLPIKPNHQQGWILREEVALSTVNYKAEVDLATNSLKVWAGDQILVETKAVTGAPRTPTPLGTFYVRDIIKKSNPNGAYGPYILALSGFSEVLETFAGGLPAIAIHGTNSPGLIGQNRSNGCIRIPNELISILAENVPLGTPVTIVA